MSFYNERGELLSSAWHEVSHYLVARALGLAVPVVSIDAALAARECGSQAKGFCAIPDLHRAPLFDQVTIYRAGCVGSDLAGYRNETGGMGGDYMHAAKLLDAAGMTGDEHRATIARAERRATKIIRANWDVAQQLVERLVRERTIRFGAPAVARAVVPVPKPVAPPKPAVQTRRMPLPMMVRSTSIRSSTFTNGRVFDCTWTSGATVRRLYDGEMIDERLLVTPDAVDMSRLAAGNAPLLGQHDASSVSSILGIVEKAWLADGYGRARVRLSARKELDGLAMDIADGIIHQLSCGYKIERAEKTHRRGDVPLLTATRWLPMELSLVCLASDPGSSITSGSSRFDAEVSERVVA